VYFLNGSINIAVLTSPSKFQFGASLRTLLVVPHKALVHALVLFFDGVYPQSAVLMVEILAVLEPTNSLDGVAFVVAGEHSRSSEIHSLSFRLDIGRKGS
jgi:hypothetical protein